MRVVVFGAGAIGRWLGALLAESGADTGLVVRPAHLPQLGEGIALRERRVSVRAVLDPGDLPPEFRTCDWLVLTVKAFAVPQALRDLAGLEPRRVLAVQNGVGSDEAVEAAFGSERTFIGSVTRAVALSEEGSPLPGPRGGVAVAPMAPGGEPGDLLERLAGRGVPVAWHGDWRAVKWSKLLLNMVANASCAILDTLPAEVLGRYGLYAVEIRALREAVRAMRALGIPVVDLPDFPVRALARAARSLPTWISYPALGPRMARGRGEKPPSLLLDLRAGRRRTEVDFVNGAVARCGVPAPVNRFLAETVEAIASGGLPWERFRGRPEALLAALGRSRRGGGGAGGARVETSAP